MSDLGEVPVPRAPGSLIQPTNQNLRPFCPLKDLAFRKIAPRGAGLSKFSRWAGRWGGCLDHPRALPRRREKRGGVWKRTSRPYHGAAWDWLATIGPRPQPGSSHSPSGSLPPAGFPDSRLAGNPQRPGHRRPSPGNRPGPARGDVPQPPGPCDHRFPGYSLRLRCQPGHPDPGPGNPEKPRPRAGPSPKPLLKEGLDSVDDLRGARPVRQILFFTEVPGLLWALASSSVDG